MLRRVGQLLLALVVLIVLVALALQLPRVRARIRDEVVSAARPYVRGTLQLDEVRWFRPDQIELSGLTVEDAHGTRVLGVSSALARLRLRSLLRGAIEVERFELSDLYVDLADLSRERGLLSAFVSESKTPSVPAKPGDPVSPVRLVVREACIERGEVRVAAAEDQHFVLRHLDTCLKLQVAQSLDAAVDSLTAELWRQDQRVLTLVAAQALPARGANASKEAGLKALITGRAHFDHPSALGFDATLKARALSPGTLAALGVSQDVLTGALDLDAHAMQLARPDSPLKFRAQLSSAAGTAEVRGDMDAKQRVHASVSTEGLWLSRVTRLALPRLDFALDAHASLADAKTVPFDAKLTRARYGTARLPVVSVTGRRDQRGDVLIPSFAVREGVAAVSGNARYAHDGALQLSARAAVPELRGVSLLRELAGEVQGELQTTLDLALTADQALSGNVDLSLNRPARAEARAARAKLAGALSGTLTRPVVQLHAHAEDVALGARRLTQAQLQVSGGPTRYTLIATATADPEQLTGQRRSVSASKSAERRAENRRQRSFRGRGDNNAPSVVARVPRAQPMPLFAEGWVEHVSDQAGWDASFSLRSQLPQGDLRLRLSRARIAPSGIVHVSALRATFLDAYLFVNGKFDLSRTGNDAHIAVLVPDTARITRAFGASEVPGRVELMGSLQGSLARPLVEATLSYGQGLQFDGKPAQLTLEANLDGKRAQAEMHLSGNAGRAKLSGELSSHWSKRLPLTAALPRAQHELELQLSQVYLPAVAELSDRGPTPIPRRLAAGNLDGTLSVHGSLDELRMAAHVASRLRAVRDSQSVDVMLDTRYEQKHLSLQTQAGDHRGKLFELLADADLDVERLLQAPEALARLLARTRFGLRAELYERALGELPTVASMELDEGLARSRASLQAQLDHAPGAEPVADMSAVLHWEPVASVGLGACTHAVDATLRTTGKWADRQLGVAVLGSFPNRDEQPLHVQAQMPLSFDQLLTGAQPLDLTNLRVDAHGKELDLQRVPVLCERGAGQVSFTASAERPLTPNAQVALSAQTHALSWDDSPPLDLTFKAQNAVDALNFSGRLDSGQGAIELAGRAPIDVREGSVDKLVHEHAPLQLDVQLNQLPMGALLAFVPGVARVSGTSHGELHLRGTPELPHASGNLSLSDVSFTLPRMGQRFAHINFDAEIKGNTLQIEHGRVRDLTGSTDYRALVRVDKPDAWQAEIEANAHNFPVRKDGVMLGHADAKLNLAARAEPDATRVLVKLDDVSIDLTSDGLVDVQSLERHPDFSFNDEQGSPAEEAQAQADPAALPVYVDIESGSPLWVRRDDFAVQMDTKLNMTLNPGLAQPLIKGNIRLLRGYISVLGKNFDIKRGEVLLSGSENIDPQLDINAEYDSPRGTVILQVGGFVQRPTLTFCLESCSNPVTAGEALMAINARSGGGSVSAESQVASAAIGMTTGLLSLGARREFGDWVPMLQIEQGDQTRVRVGFEADRLIPKFLRGFVRGAYVEGIMASQSSSSGRSSSAQQSTQTTSANTASGSGVLLELTLPSNFVWAGQYGPGQAWSVDLDFRP